MRNPVTIIIKSDDKAVSCIFITIRCFKKANEWRFQKTFIIDYHIMFLIKRCSGDTVTLQQSIVR